MNKKTYTQSNTKSKEKKKIFKAVSFWGFDEDLNPIMFYTNRTLNWFTPVSNNHTKIDLIYLHQSINNISECKHVNYLQQTPIHLITA